MSIKVPPPIPLTEVTKQVKVRSSNLELYRIICMLMIVAHHYVVNSGLTIRGGGPLLSDISIENGFFLTLFGAWGKTGINCFMMITGYFMCTSKISLRKFVKLIGQIYFYRWLIYLIFLILGYESVTPLRVFKLILPFWNITDGFISCFIAFWLTIPFWTILVQNMTKKQHQLLLLFVIGVYTILGSIPTFDLLFNYVTWFGIIFLIASYLRLYPHEIFNRKNLWGWLTLLCLMLAVLSIVVMHWKFGFKGIAFSYLFVSDSNKIFAVAVAITSFLWFKNMDIKYSKVINAVGGATFGVLLIHANSDVMRIWLWKDTIDVIGHSALPLGKLMFFSIGVVLTIFIMCNIIDQLRINTLERLFFSWYDKKISATADKFVSRITSE